MTRARWRALAAIAILLIAVAVAVAVLGRQRAALGPRPEGERPTLLLLTTLPLVLPDEFTLKDAGSPALAALRTRYTVVPISVASPQELAKGKLLLMVQPQAQPADDLVALDGWVRRGGRLLLLADPLLEWPSSRPLGDPLRPSPTFADTGLLMHWGLRLDPPEQPGPVPRKLAGRDIVANSPGRLVGGCPISADGLRARCAIGRGRAIVIPDADFLDVDRLGDGAKHNLDGLLAELAELEAR